jgi:hypothetical protein
VVFFVVEKIVGRHVCLGFSELLALLACEVTKSETIRVCLTGNYEARLF